MVGEDLEAEGEDTMNTHEEDARSFGKPRRSGLVEPTGVVRPTRQGDLVVDLSGVQSLDLMNLALLLTAQRQVEQEDRRVWLAGVPPHLWQALRAMGLGAFFEAFPSSRERVA